MIWNLRFLMLIFSRRMGVDERFECRIFENIQFTYKIFCARKEIFKNSGWNYAHNSSRLHLLWYRTSMTFWTKKTLASPLRAICGEKNLTLSFKSCRKCWTLFFVWEQKISEGVFSSLCCSVSTNWILANFSRYDYILRIYSSSNLNFWNIKNSCKGSEIQKNESW